MDSSPELSSLRQARRTPYLVGLILCVLWPLILQILLTRLPQGEPSAPSVVESLGHTFTGLIALAAAWAIWRRARAKAALSEQELTVRCASLRRETLRAAALFGSCSLLGLLYFGAAGPRGERHARSYIAAVPVMFFVFVPRIRAFQAPEPPGHCPGRD